MISLISLSARVLEESFVNGSHIDVARLPLVTKGDQKIAHIRRERERDWRRESHGLARRFLRLRRDARDENTGGAGISLCLWMSMWRVFSNLLTTITTITAKVYKGEQMG